MGSELSHLYSHESAYAYSELKSSERPLGSTCSRLEAKQYECLLNHAPSGLWRLSEAFARCERSFSKSGCPRFCAIQFPAGMAEEGKGGIRDTGRGDDVFRVLRQN